MPTLRKIVAVGDLHGDFHRLCRLLSDEGLLDAGKLAWTSKATDADVVLLGDYVDWRGEPLEGPRDEWPEGTRKLAELIHRLASISRKSGVLFYPLRGNHDQMMLDGYAFIDGQCKKEPGMLGRFSDIDSLLRYLSYIGLDRREEEDLMRFYNWYEQGGGNTIQSFGGLHAWLAALSGELGDFFRLLPLAVVVNGKLFCHSVPDSKEFWVPLQERQKISRDSVNNRAAEQYLWGRKMWGYDAFTGGTTAPLSEEEVDEMLNAFQVKGVVVGHTPLHRGAPYFHYGGKVVNLDAHGVPGSKAFVEEYEAVPKGQSPKGRKRSGKR